MGGVLLHPLLNIHSYLLTDDYEITPSLLGTVIASMLNARIVRGRWVSLQMFSARTLKQTMSLHVYVESSSISVSNFCSGAAAFSKSSAQSLACETYIQRYCSNPTKARQERAIPPFFDTTSLHTLVKFLAKFLSLAVLSCVHASTQAVKKQKSHITATIVCYKK